VIKITIDRVNSFDIYFHIHTSQNFFMIPCKSNITYILHFVKYGIISIIITMTDTSNHYAKSAEYCPS